MKTTSLLVGAALSLGACSKTPLGQLLGAKDTTPAVADPADSKLTESYRSKNDLITIHYPAAFAAKSPLPETVVLAHNFSDGGDEAVAFSAIPTPVTDELQEFARVVQRGAVSKLQNFKESGHSNIKCNGVDGVEFRGAWGDGPTGSYFSRACAFVREGHGYYTWYSAPFGKQAEREPILKAIVDATEFNGVNQVVDPPKGTGRGQLVDPLDGKGQLADPFKGKGQLVDPFKGKGTPVDPLAGKHNSPSDPLAK